MRRAAVGRELGGVSTFDAQLVIVAERLDLVLVTADRELVAAFPGRRVQRRSVLNVSGHGTTSAEDCGKMLTEVIICEYFPA